MLEVCDALPELPGWVRQAGPQEANEVLLALAELGAADGGDDPVATAALLWLLLPGAVGVAHALRSVSDQIDELVAGQLWICARTVSWAKGVAVAATVLMNTRREVLNELGLSKEARAAGYEVPTADLAYLCGRWSFATPVGTGTSQDSAAGEDAALLRGLLEDAIAVGVVTGDDAHLLLRLAQAADTRRGGRGLGGLLARSTSTDVAREWGVSRASVTRRADRALRALRQTYAREGRAA
ncbi:hypothetical protein [Ornithinimicrobium panacihumi]|uniref:hypothetical protein n=1 Tax=Ornithinimicrobium panacihumi TaxID=2008449 RepID=UPI003F8BDE10